MTKIKTEKNNIFKNRDSQLNGLQKAAFAILIVWLIFGGAVMQKDWITKHWYIAGIGFSLLPIIGSFIVKPKAKQETEFPDNNFKQCCDTTQCKNSAENAQKQQENKSLNYKFNKYLELISLIDAYKPRIKSKQTSAIFFFCILFILLTVAATLSTALNTTYVFLGGAILALIYKLIDMMNTDTKTAFDKKTAYIDKLIDINLELEKNGQPCEQRTLIIDSLVKNIVK
ncbi:hypothetical protein [Leuconostoc mesenteroides]|uniref:hypothetical protein n=1 Tax=Leuconostoc mesenteroides TaxID=1245 RepID=UPI00338DBC9A